MDMKNRPRIILSYPFSWKIGCDIALAIIFLMATPAYAQSSPAVTITSPANGGSLVRTVTVAANASGSAGVTQVQFQIDGVNLGAAVTGAGPAYITSWDTTTLADGPHTVSAIATDTQGHQTTVTISVSVTNALKLNQRIQTTGVANVFATASNSGTLLGSQSAGALGTIAGGPSSDGTNTWWQITYDNTPSGWTVSTSLLPLPSLNLQANAWLPIQPTYMGMPNGGRLFPQGWANKGTYDPATHRVILSDHWADSVRDPSFISIFANGIYALDPVTNVFTVLKLNNWYAQVNSNGGYTTTALPANTTDPTPTDHHPLQALEVVPQQNAVYTVNGVNSISLPDPTILNKTWKLDFGTHTWTLLSSDKTDPNYPPNNPSNTSGLIYEPTNKKLVYFLPTLCGCNGTVTYIFDPAVNTWSILPQDASSFGVNISGAGVTYDSKRDLILAYGGNNYNTATGTAHLWAYSVTQNKWTQLKDAPVTGTAPAFAYDSKQDVFLAVVGNDTYIYNPNSNTWAQFPATLNRPITFQTWQGVTYDPAYDVFVFEGGSQLAPLIALFRYDPNSPPSLSFDTGSPTATITSPSNGATVLGTITFSATAADAVNSSSTDNVGVIGLQFLLDGASMTGVLSGSGPYAIGWNTTSATNGQHTLTAVAIDEVGNTGSASVTVTVNNPSPQPVLTNITVSSITASGATINWTTDQSSDSQVAFGLTNSYGSLSSLGNTLVTSHAVILSGLAASTTYHFQAMSRDSSGFLGTSGDFTFTTTATSLTPLFQLHADATEVSGVTNGSTITPAVAPPGFVGTVLVTGTGSVNYAPAQSGNGVFFLSCCSNPNTAYYKFTGAAIGNIFNISQGQATFYLKSRYSFSQRQTSAAAPRYAFDVRDATNTNHLFYFLTEISSSSLIFSYRTGGASQFYYVPRGTEDTLFGTGVILKVTIIWSGSVTKLFFNDSLVQTLTDTRSTPNWTSASNFDIGAYEYLTNGGFNTSDDVIDEFTIFGPTGSTDTTPPTVTMTAPSNGATVSGSVTISANATDNVAMSKVQFLLDGATLGSPVSGPGPAYQFSWDTTTASNASHTLSAIAYDNSGNSATAANISVTVSNIDPPPVITVVSAGSISSSAATITWTTDKPSTSQVAYGLTNAYGTLSTLQTSFVTSHSVILAGLTSTTTYHYQVLSKDSAGNLSSSGDFAFTTTTVPVGPQPMLLLHADASEVSGTTNGSTVTPSTGPAGFTGTVVVNSGGSVNYTPAQRGNGVFFLNCCTNTGNAYYKFTGTPVGNIFTTSSGQVNFFLKSQFSFAQRKSTAASPRYSFDVRDGNTSNHLFYFLTEVGFGSLVFSYRVCGTTFFYYAPAGTEDTLFGSGVILNVKITWDGSTAKLYLNGNLVQSSPYTATTPNWTSSSNFDLGAYEYQTFGGYNVSDDIIDEFTVAPLQ
jgi:hypothetical protein